MLCRISNKLPKLIGFNSVKAVPVFASSSNFSTDTSKKMLLVDRVKAIDTTLTPEQKEYVESIKKRLKGGHKSPKSIYREVPTPDQVKGLGHFMPRMAENAEELIDYALSHLPKKTGPRRSRAKKRMALKQATKRAFDKKKKEERIAAHYRRLAKKKRQKQEIKDMWAQVESIRAKETAIAEFKAKNATQKST